MNPDPVRHCPLATISDLPPPFCRRLPPVATYCRRPQITATTAVRHRTNGHRGFISQPTMPLPPRLQSSVNNHRNGRNPRPPVLPIFLFSAAEKPQPPSHSRLMRKSVCLHLFFLNPAPPSQFPSAPLLSCATNAPASGSRRFHTCTNPDSPPSIDRRPHRPLSFGKKVASNPPSSPLFLSQPLVVILLVLLSFPRQYAAQSSNRLDQHHSSTNSSRHRLFSFSVPSLIYPESLPFSLSHTFKHNTTTTLRPSPTVELRTPPPADSNSRHFQFLPSTSDSSSFPLFFFSFCPNSPLLPCLSFSSNSPDSSLIFFFFTKVLLVLAQGTILIMHNNKVQSNKYSVLLSKH